MQHPAVRAGHQRGEIESQPGATGVTRSRRIAAIERFTDMLRLLRRNARPAIANLQHQVGALDREHQFHGAAIRGRITQRVTHQVLEQQRDPRLVDVGDRAVATIHYFDPVPVPLEKIVDKRVHQRPHADLRPHEGFVATVQALGLQERDDDLLHLD